MDGWKQLCFLFLPVCACIDRVSVVKTVGREAHITPICTSTNTSVIILVKCLISTVTHSKDECKLLYAVDKKPNDDECDSRFTLQFENGAVIIHLVNLTPEDSGNYTCECSYERGTQVVHHHITVEDGERDVSTHFSSIKFIASLAITVTVLAMSVVTAWIVCDHIQRRNYPSRGNTRSQASASTRCETLWHLDQADVYAGLQYPDTDVYHTFHLTRAEEDPDDTYSAVQEDGREKDLHEFAVYETIQN